MEYGSFVLTKKYSLVTRKHDMDTPKIIVRHILFSLNRFHVKLRLKNIQRLFLDQFSEIFAHQRKKFF